MSTHILDAGRATWISEAASGTSYYDRPTLALDGAGADEKRALLWFPNPVANGGEVLDAQLYLTLANAWSGTIVVTARRITQTWKEKTASWGSAGTTPTSVATNSATVTVTNGVAGDVIQLDLTDMLGDVADGGAWYGVRLSLDSGSGRLHSPNATTPTYRPRLEVSLGVLPDAPDNLRPDGDNYTTCAPEDGDVPDGAMTYPLVFRWTFASSDVNAYQSQSRVQASLTEGSASAGDAYDSGWVSNDLTNWSVADDDETAALDDYDDFYWIVTVRDQNGLESAASEEAHFFRHALGDVMISDPAGDDDDVDDSTPTITWQYDDAGASNEQRLVRIRVYEGTGNALGALLYERPWTVQTQDDDDGTETFEILPVGYDTFTIPASVPSRRGDGAPIISTPDAKYAVEVAIRDAYSRPDAEYVSDVRYFDYVPGTSVTAPTSLTATAATTGSWIDLTWQRASTPDFYVILRDGVAIAELDGEDCFDSGTTFSWRDYSALPGVAHTYTVRAKTSGDGVSASPAGAAATTAPVGVWLTWDAGVAGTATDLIIPILGDSRIATALSERSETFAPLNRRDAVRIVSRIGGYDGSVNGSLSEWAGYDVDDLRDDIETIFGQHSTDALRLVFGKRNLGVSVGGLVVDQRPELANDDAIYDVTFSFWQTDDFTVEVN